MKGGKRERAGRTTTDLGVTREVGLALRAHRRERGESQRAYAAARQLSRELPARVEVDAGATSLSTVGAMLDRRGLHATGGHALREEAEALGRGGRAPVASLSARRELTSTHLPRSEPDDLPPAVRAGARRAPAR